MAVNAQLRFARNTPHAIRAARRAFARAFPGAEVGSRSDALRLPTLRTKNELQRGLDVLTAYDRAYLARHPRTPSILDGDVRYRREYPKEEWLGIPLVMQRHVGDCEDLAAWLAAETGGRAIPVRQPSGNWHIITQLRDGSTFDPSLALGAKPLRPNEVKKGRR